MDDLKSRGVRSFIWDVSGKTAMHLTSFVITIFLARMLDPSAFGLIAIAMVLVEVAQVLSDVGLGSALIQRRKLHSSHYASVFVFNIFIGLSLTFLTYQSATLISEFYSNPDLVPIVEAMAFIFLINSIASVQINKLIKELNYGLITKCGYLALLISGIIGISLAFLGYGVWSLVVQQILRAFLNCLFIWVISGWVPGFNFSFKAIRHLWRFGFYMFLSALLDTVFNKLDIVIIGRLFQASTLGFFDRAKALDQMLITYTAGSLMAVLFPVLSSIQNDLPRFINVINKAFCLICFVIFLLVGGLYIVADEVILILFTEKWMASAGYLKLLLLSGFSYPLSALLVNVLSSRGRSRQFLVLEILKKSLHGCNLYLGFFWGIEGYLYGLIIVSMLSFLLNLIFAAREVDLAVFLFIKVLLFQIAITVSSVAVILEAASQFELNPYLMLVSKGALFTLAYYVLNRLFGTQSYKYAMEGVNQVVGRFKQKRQP